MSPGHRRGRSRSRSPAGKRKFSLVREGSEERRAKIEQWNREREQKENASEVKTGGINHNGEKGYNGYSENGDQRYGYEEQHQKQQRLQQGC